MFGKQPTVSPAELAWAAVSEAFADAGDDSVDAVFVGSVFGEPGVAQRALSAIGITGIPVITIENACASGTSAFHLAASAVEAQSFDRVLAFGLEVMTPRFGGAILPEQADFEGAAGLALPALYALGAARYQYEFDLTNEQLAMVAVKNHRNAMQNPRAQRGSELSVGQVLGSRMIADPLTVLQCSPISDGAAAAVLGRSRLDGGRDVRVRSCVLGSGELWDNSSTVWGYELVQQVARRALEKAAVDISDVDVVELHDAFTFGEIVTTEALGLAERGGGGELVERGDSDFGGIWPVNPSGGLIGRGHPLGATGLAQVAEIVWQLRGEAEGRQVPDASIGLVETMGGGVAGIDGNACVVTVLERS